MAGLRKLRGKYYIRLRLPNGKEKLIPTKTGDRRLAEARKRLVEEREFLVKARLIEDLLKTDERLFKVAGEFLASCRTRLRPSTCRSYGQALRRLKECWGDIPIREITGKHVQSLTPYLSARVNPTTVNINLRSIRAFLNWLVHTDRMDRFPGKIAFVKVDDELPKFFRPEELERILAHVKKPQNRAAIRVLAKTGLRRSELGEGTLEGTFLHLHQTKGRRDRLVPIDPNLIPDFILATSGGYSPDTITRAFLKAVKDAGVPKKGRNLHSLRHTFALSEYWRTRDIYHVKRMLGHSTVAVTERYLKFPDEYLIQIFGERSPIPGPAIFPAAQVQDLSLVS